MRTKLLTTTALAFGLAYGGMALAQQTPPAQQNQQSQQGQQGQQAQTGQQGQTQQAQQDVTAEDKEFFTKAIQDGMAEVKLGELAQDKAQDEEVKSFAQRMVEDHGKANDKLKQAAQSAGVTPPTEVSEKHKATEEKLSGLSGQEFDQEYMKAQVEDHQKAVELFSKQAQGSGETAQLAGEILPTLEEHLDMAQRIEEELGQSGMAQQGESQQGQQQAATQGQQGQMGQQGQQQAVTAQQGQSGMQAQDSADVTYRSYAKGGEDFAGTIMGDMPASDLMGRTISNQEGEEIAEISDLLIANDEISKVIIDVGGFLGIGQRSVALDISELQPGQDGDFVVNMSQEQLEQLPRFEEQEDNWQPWKG
jgi:putative membrane protein